MCPLQMRRQNYSPPALHVGPWKSNPCNHAKMRLHHDFFRILLELVYFHMVYYSLLLCSFIKYSAITFLSTDNSLLLQFERSLKHLYHAPSPRSLTDLITQQIGTKPPPELSMNDVHKFGDAIHTSQSLFARNSPLKSCDKVKMLEETSTPAHKGKEHQ